MPFDRPTLIAAIKASGGAEQPDDQLDGLLAKLAFLEQTGRYRGLFPTLSNANDKSNFLAALLEATFAFQFETAGMPLTYEVHQVPGEPSSIDFKLDAHTGDSMFFEVRLLQQGGNTAQSIEQADVFRLQSAVLQKVQKADGTPIKFLQSGAGIVNIVVVGVSDIVMGMADPWDCLLAMYGDPEVPEHCRRGVFGLFQEVKPEYPAEIQTRAKSYARMRSTLHGALFVFRAKGAGVLDYQLQQVMVWNRNLATGPHANALMVQIADALSPLPWP